MTLSRRDFLAALAAAAAVPVLPSIAGAGEQTDLVRDFFTDEAAVRKIGELYLTAFPGERDATTLQSLIAPGGTADWFDTTTAKELTAHIRTQVRADFGSAFNTRTVVLSGWVLAVTEARLAALVIVGP